MERPPGSRYKAHHLVTYAVLINMTPAEYALHGSPEAIERDAGVTAAEALMISLEARKERQARAGPPCPSCGSQYHRSQRDRRCPNNPQTRQQAERRRGDARFNALNANPLALERATNMRASVFFATVMPKNETYTRVFSFARAIRLDVLDILQQRIRECRAELNKVLPITVQFLADFLLHHPQEDADFVFSGNGLYQASMVVRQTMRQDGQPGERANPHPRLPAALPDHWDQFVEGTGIRRVQIQAGFTTLLSEEMRPFAATMKRHVCDLLELRVKSFVKFKMTQIEAPLAAIAAAKELIWEQFKSDQPLMIRPGVGAPQQDENGEEDLQLLMGARDHEEEEDDDQDQAAPARRTRARPAAAVDNMERIAAQHLPAVLGDVAAEVLAILEGLAAVKPQDMGEITIESLRSHPSLCIPIHIYIMQQYDAYREEDPEDPIEVPSYTLLPMPAQTPRFLTLNANTLRQVLPNRFFPATHPLGDNRGRHRGLAPFVDLAHQFWALINWPNLGLGVDEEHQLRDGFIMGHQFNGVIRTDGVQVHICFRRLRRPQPPALLDRDLAHQPIDLFSASGVDPGRKVIATSAFDPTEEDWDDDRAPRAIRRITLDEYRDIAGEQERARALQLRKDLPLPDHGHLTMNDLESQTPWPKTADVATFRSFVAFKDEHAATIAEFYGPESSAARFEAYKGKQRAVSTTANTILGTGNKCCKPRQLSQQQQQQQPRNMANLRRNRRRRLLKAKHKRQGREERAAAAAAATTVQQAPRAMPPSSQQDDASFGSLTDDEIIAALDAAVAAAPSTPEDDGMFGSLADEDVIAALDAADVSQTQAPAAAAPSIPTPAAAHISDAAHREQHLPPPPPPHRRRAQTTMRPRKRQFHNRNAINQNVPVVAFGGALVAKEAVRIRGLPIGRSSMVLRHLFQRQLRGLVMTVVTNEFRTSRTCAHCHTPVILARRDGRSVFGSVFCPSCGRTVDRDANAASNILSILHSQSLVGRRPPSMTRPQRAQQQAPPPQRRRRRGLADDPGDARPARRRRI